MLRLRRWVLMGVGLGLAALALCALLYVLAPVERQREQARPAPTLFAPPP